MAGLLGLNCLNPMLVLIGYKVSSSERYSSGITCLQQFFPKISKSSLIAANLSCFHRAWRVERSSKEMQAYKNWNRFLLMVAPNGWGPMRALNKYFTSWLHIPARPRKYISPINAKISVSSTMSIKLYQVLLLKFKFCFAFSMRWFVHFTTISRIFCEKNNSHDDLASVACFATPVGPGCPIITADLGCRPADWGFWFVHEMYSSEIFLLGAFSIIAVYIFGFDWGSNTSS